MTISISFIIPTFNRSKILRDGVVDYLKILRKINNLKFEIILVNDSSHDDTSLVISDLVAYNPEIIAINLSKNAGPGIARNAGLQVAAHEYSWFLDDDDRIDQQGVQEIIDLINTNSVDETLMYGHSLQKEYSPSLNGGARKKQVLKNIILFREKQEVFNWIFNTNFLLKNKIKFSNGVHEDISFIVNALSNVKKIRILNSIVYIKSLHEDSITFSMNQRRIDGFIAAYFEILDINHIHRYFDSININDFRAQIFGVICYLIVKGDSDSGIILLSYFIAELRKRSLVESLPSDYDSTNSNLKYAVSTLANGITDKLSSKILFDRLNDIFNSHLSCKDLNSSIFLGPNEIRACCKRFFVNGRQKGDVVLLPASPDIRLEEINFAKQKLISEINREESAVCAGCPYIERVHSGLDKHKIDYISLENFAYSLLKSPHHRCQRPCSQNVQVVHSCTQRVQNQTH